MKIMRRFYSLCVLLAVSVSAFCQPLLVGHRGCRKVAGIDENTIAALKYAQAVPVDYVEFDVNLTSDDKVIVFHGPKVPGIDRDVRNMTFDEARAVTLPYGGHMPTLEEWFDQVKKHPDVKVIMELKKTGGNHDRDRKLVRVAMEQVRRLGVEHLVSYTTFSKTMCKEIHNIDPSAKVLFLQSTPDPMTAEEAGRLGYNGISYNLDAWMNNPSIVEHAKELGIETTLWLANDAEVIDWAVRHKVDCISVDDPVKAKKILGGY